MQKRGKMLTGNREKEREDAIWEVGLDRGRHDVVSELRIGITLPDTYQNWWAEPKYWSPIIFVRVLFGVYWPDPVLFGFVFFILNIWLCNCVIVCLYFYGYLNINKTNFFSLFCNFAPYYANEIFLECIFQVKISFVTPKKKKTDF